MKKRLVICFITLTFIVAFCMGFIFSWVFEKKPVVIEKEKIVKIKEEKLKNIEVNEWVNIPTYEKSNETTHPKVLYFDKPVNGYKYWLVSTPYPYNTAFYENPSMVVSNDGTHFVEPDNLKNPISGYPSKYWDGTYYSDPYMLYDNDRFELFYRKTSSDSNNYVYMKTSSDGITWSDAKIILNNDPNEQYMSISVVKLNNKYKIWYVNYNNSVRYIESDDLITYTKPVNVSVSDFNGRIWHGEIQYINNKYVWLFMIKYKLFYSESTDGINFSKPKLINTELDELKNISNNIYKSTYIINDDTVELYIPYRVYDEYKKRHVWRIRHKKVDKSKFYD